MKNHYTLSFYVMPVLLAFMACSKKPEATEQPVAQFTWPATIIKGTECTFTNTSTGADTYVWKLNGADVATTTDLKHTFAATGTYEVTLVATRGTASVTKKENVTVQLPPIQADFTWEIDAQSPWAVKISLAPGSNADAYELYFDDWVPARGWSGRDTVYYLAPKDQAASANGHNYHVKLTARRAGETPHEVTKVVKIKDQSMRAYFPVTPGTFSQGNTVVNVSGSGSEYIATPTSGVRLGPNKFNTPGEALVFGGAANDELALPLNYLKYFTANSNAICISFFVKFSDLSDLQPLLSAYSDQTHVEKLIYYEGGYLKARWPATEALQNIPQVAINDNAWHHVVFYATGTNQVMFVDATQVIANYATPGTKILGSGNMLINGFGYGLIAPNVTRQFKGSMDNIRLFDRALTYHEMIALRDEK